MAYHLRVFCASERRPALADVLAWTEEHGHALWLDPIPPVDPAIPGWKEAAIRYDHEKSPFLLEATYAGEQLLADELATFAQLVGETRFGLRRLKVLSHLHRTELVISARLPRYDLDKQGSDAAAAVLDFFVSNCDGMIQADGEGFYKGGKILLTLR